MSNAALPRLRTLRLTLRPLEMTEAVSAFLPETGRDTATSKARLESGTLIAYAVTRETLKVGP